MWRLLCALRGWCFAPPCSVSAMGAQKVGCGFFITLFFYLFSLKYNLYTINHQFKVYDSISFGKYIQSYNHNFNQERTILSSHPPASPVPFAVNPLWGRDFSGAARAAGSSWSCQRHRVGPPLTGREAEERLTIPGRLLWVGRGTEAGVGDAQDTVS